MDGVSVDDGTKTRVSVLKASRAGPWSHAVDVADHPGDQPRRDGRFRNDAADARRPDFDLSLPRLQRRRSQSARRWIVSWCPAGFLSLLIGTVIGAMVSGLATGRGVSFSDISARRRDIRHADVSDDACCQAIVAGALWSWSGAILSIGNIGMLLSSSSVGLVADHYGRRSGF